METTRFLKKRHILALLFLLICALLVYGIFLVKAWLRSLQDPKIISATISRAIECPVDIEKVSISAGGRLILGNVVIYTPDAVERRRDMLTAPIILASFSPLKILLGRPEESLTSIELRDPTLRIAPDTLEWFKKRPRKGKGALPPLIIKSGTLEISGFPLVSLRQFKKVRGTLKLGDPRWECDLSGTSSDLREKWEFQGKGPASGKPLMKMRGQNVEVADFAEERALKGLAGLKGRMDFSAEYLEPDGWKGKVDAGQLAVAGTEVSKFSASFSQKGEQMSITGLSFLVSKGTVSGEGTLDMTRPSPALHMKGSMKDIPLENLAPSIRDLPLRGSLTASWEITGEEKSLRMQGDFEVANASLSPELKDLQARGDYSLAGERLLLKTVKVKSPYGTLDVDGDIEKGTYLLHISSPDLDLSKAFSETTLCALPEKGTVKVTIKGTAGETLSEGVATFPVIQVQGRSIQGFSLKGAMHVKKDLKTFKDLTATLGAEEFPLEGSISKGKEGQTLVSLKGLPPQLLDYLAPGNLGKIFSLEGNSLDLDLDLRKKAFSGALTTGKGIFREIPFETIKATFVSKDEKSVDVQGTISAGNAIEFSGKLAREAIHLEAKAPQFALKDLTFIKPHLAMASENNVMKGTLTSTKMMAGKETLSKVSLSFQETTPEHYGLSGTLSWASNAIGLSGTMDKKQTALKLTADDFTLESLDTASGKWPKMSGKGHLELSLLRKGGKDSYSVTLSSKNLAIDKKKFPPLSVSLIPEKELVTIKSLVMKDDTSSLSLSGTLSLAKSGMDLKGEVKDQALENLSSFIETSALSLKGRLTGSLRVRGAPEKPAVTFDGTASNLRVSELALGSGKLYCVAEGRNITGSFSPASPNTLISSLFSADARGSIADALKGDWKTVDFTFSKKGEAPLELKGEALHGTLGMVLFKGKMEKDSCDMTFSPRQISIAQLTFIEPDLHITKKGDLMSGAITAKTGKMDTLLLTSPHFTFEERDGLSFTGDCSVFDSEATITGRSSGGAMNYTCKMPSFNLKNLGFFKIKEDNLSGVGSFEATITQGNEKSLRFSLQGDNFCWGKKKLPRISLEAEQKKTIILVSALRIFTGAKPIFIAGTIVPDKQTCALNGKIEEASLPTLIDMAGGKAPDLQGNLNGALSIQGDMKKPEFRFEGRVLQLVYKGKDMGDGTLKVGGTSQAINGRLDLDKPPKYRAGLAPANVEISYYFTIEGTAKDPVIKPQASGTKLNVNPGIIWQLFQIAH